MLENPFSPALNILLGKFHQDCLAFMAAWRSDKCSENSGNVNCANQLCFTENLLFQSENLLLSIRISAFSCILTWLRMNCSLNGISWGLLLQVDVIISSQWLWLWKLLKGTGDSSCVVQGLNMSCNFIRYVYGKAEPGLILQESLGLGTEELILWFAIENERANSLPE